MAAAVAVIAAVATVAAVASAAPPTPTAHPQDYGAYDVALANLEKYIENDNSDDIDLLEWCAVNDKDPQSAADRSEFCRYWVETPEKGYRYVLKTVLSAAGGAGFQADKMAESQAVARDGSSE